LASEAQRGKSRGRGGGRRRRLELSCELRVEQSESLCGARQLRSLTEQSVAGERRTWLFARRPSMTLGRDESAAARAHARLGRLAGSVQCSALSRVHGTPAVEERMMGARAVLVTSQLRASSAVHRHLDLALQAAACYALLCSTAQFRPPRPRPQTALAAATLPSSLSPLARLARKATRPARLKQRCSKARTSSVNPTSRPRLQSASTSSSPPARPRPRLPLDLILA